MKKKMKRMDMGGEVESRDDDNRMERRRMKRGDMEGRRKMMMDKIEGYHGKSRGDFDVKPDMRAKIAEGVASRMRPQVVPPAPMPRQSDMRANAMAAPPRMANPALGKPMNTGPGAIGGSPVGLGGALQNMQASMAQNVMNKMSPKPVAPPAMRGGGLARKGVGQALKAGGAVRACGVAKRGKTKGKMV